MCVCVFLKMVGSKKVMKKEKNIEKVNKQNTTKNTGIRFDFGDLFLLFIYLVTTQGEVFL